MPLMSSALIGNGLSEFSAKSDSYTALQPYSNHIAQFTGCTQIPRYINTAVI